MVWKLITALLLVPSALAVPAPDGSLCVKTGPVNCTLTFIGDIGPAKTCKFLVHFQLPLRCFWLHVDVATDV